MDFNTQLKRQVAHWLPRLESRRARWPYKWIYPIVLHFYRSGNEPIPVNLHGFETLINPGNTYPQIAHLIPFFNAPLVQLVHLARQTMGRPIKVVDVGAATGDTILLLEQRCPGDVEKYFCVEGDSEFAALLKQNMQQFPHVAVIQCLLSRQRCQIRSLVKHHLGTASATGADWVEAVPLDDVFASLDVRIDVLKIDVDGYDGEVLQGARSLLKNSQPWIIFEWHPVLIEKAGQGTADAFEALISAGYRRFIWFNNVGTFSHFSSAPDREDIQRLRDYLVAVNHRADDHYDVVALPDSALHIEAELAGLEYARQIAFSKRALPALWK